MEKKKKERISDLEKDLTSLIKDKGSLRKGCWR